MPSFGPRSLTSRSVIPPRRRSPAAARVMHCRLLQGVGKCQDLPVSLTGSMHEPRPSALTLEDNSNIRSPKWESVRCAALAADVAVDDRGEPCLFRLMQQPNKPPNHVYRFLVALPCDWHRRRGVMLRGYPPPEHRLTREMTPRSRPCSPAGRSRPSRGCRIGFGRCRRRPWRSRSAGRRSRTFGSSQV